jgi:hypothetical protein
MLKVNDVFDYLIHLTASAINNTKPLELPENLTFKQLFSFGKPHEIVNLVYYAIEKLENKPDEPLLTKWRELRDHAIVKDINQMAMAEEFRNILKSGEVPFYEMQGTRMKPLYPRADMRTMSDIDFIIHPESVSRVDNLFKSAGYETEIVENDEIQFSLPPNIFVEIHSVFSPDGDRSADYLKELIISEDEKLNEKAFYLFSILHTAKHYYGHGCGIRRILDIYLLNRKYPDMLGDEFIKKCLKKSGMLTFAKNISLLADYWFGESHKETKTIRKMGIIIKTSALHGVFDGNANDSIKMRKAYGMKSAKLKYLLNRIFPPLILMIQLFPILGKHHWLLPVFWIYRWLRAIFTKSGDILVFFKTMFKGGKNKK